MGGLRLAIHGGAGTIPSAREDPDYAAEARRGAAEALARGHEVLARGGPALEAVVEAVAALEDCPAFNAGRGSVLTSAGRVEMDAAVMDGADRRAGAVAGLRALANPVRAALAVLERSEHVLLAGEGAESFARAAGAEPADPEWLATPERRAQLERARARGRAELDRAEREGATVGAVARDAHGHLAAATSTGGMTNKLPGRVSDSCQIGAGTWADDATCAVSGTGHGEAFLRCAFAHEVDALLRHAGLGLDAACDRALTAVAAVGGRGGCIAVDAAGRLALRFDTSGMPRGWVAEDGAPHLAIHPGDVLDAPPER